MKHVDYVKLIEGDRSSPPSAETLSELKRIALEHSFKVPLPPGLDARQALPVRVVQTQGGEARLVEEFPDGTIDVTTFEDQACGLEVYMDPITFERFARSVSFERLLDGFGREEL